MHSPTVAFHSSQVGSLSFNGGKKIFFVNHWHFLVFVLSVILLPVILPPPHQHLNIKAFRIFASDSNLMGTFERRCLLSYQPRNVLSKQNKSNRSLPILLQRLESHGNIISIFKNCYQCNVDDTTGFIDFCRLWHCWGGQGTLTTNRSVGQCFRIHGQYKFLYPSHIRFIPVAQKKGMAFLKTFSCNTFSYASKKWLV